VVLCRAGAMTVSELILSAKPSILIPLPHAIDNHQFYNAKILADNLKDWVSIKRCQTLIK
jgi:UDP-N-acetylglucosamine--N-acetylmuramyl-(pentapeptide) pyrophosphoryl-undecaprenol N-acetylglucosamine transferase